MSADYTEEEYEQMERLGIIGNPNAGGIIDFPADFSNEFGISDIQMALAYSQVKYHADVYGLKFDEYSRFSEIVIEQCNSRGVSLSTVVSEVNEAIEKVKSLNDFSTPKSMNWTYYEEIVDMKKKSHHAKTDYDEPMNRRQRRNRARSMGEFKKTPGGRKAV